MDVPTYNQRGEKVSILALPEVVFNVQWNADLVHQVTVAQQGNVRTPVAHAKDRSEVRGGGRKPWRQKGTGRARHGSIRSPLWRGGGVTFGPRNDKNYSKKVNRKMRVRALCSVLSQKLRDGEVLFVDGFHFEAPKTKDAKMVLEALAGIKGFEKLATKKRNAVFIALGEKNANVERSFNNIGTVDMDEVRNMNPLDLLTSTYVIITEPEKSVTFLEGKRASKNGEQN